MGLIMRRNLMAAKSGYVMDGLISMFDGEFSEHTDDGTKWYDFVKKTRFVEKNRGNTSFDRKSLSISGKAKFSTTSDLDDIYNAVENDATVEMCYRAVSRGTAYDDLRIFLWQTEPWRTFNIGTSKNGMLVNGIGASRFAKSWRENATVQTYDPDNSASLLGFHTAVATMTPETLNVSVDDFTITGYNTWVPDAGYIRNNYILRIEQENSNWVGNLYSLRFYNRVLSAAEIAANYEIDKARFNLT